MGLSRGHMLFLKILPINFFFQVGEAVGHPAPPFIRLWGLNNEKVKINLVIFNNAYIEVVFKENLETH